MSQPGQALELDRGLWQLSATKHQIRWTSICVVFFSGKICLCDIVLDRAGYGAGNYSHVDNSQQAVTRSIQTAVPRMHVATVFRLPSIGGKPSEHYK